VGEGRSVQRVLVGRPEWKRPLGQTGFSWLRTETKVSFCEHGNEPMGSIKKASCFSTS